LNRRFGLPWACYVSWTNATVIAASPENGHPETLQAVEYL